MAHRRPRGTPGHRRSAASGKRGRCFDSLRKARLYDAVALATPNGVAIVDPVGRILHANARMANLLGLPVAGLVGTPMAHAVGDSLAGSLRLPGRTADPTPEIEFNPPHRPEIYARLAAIPLGTETGYPGHWLIVARDATEVAQANFRLVRELTFLSEVEVLNREISGQTNLARIARLVCETAVAHSDLAHVALIHAQPGRDALEIAGASFEAEPHTAPALGARTLVTRVFETGRTIVSGQPGPDVEISHHPIPLGGGPLCPVLGVPVHSQGRVEAVLVGFREARGEVDPDDLYHLEHLAAVMGTALRDAHLLSERERHHAELGHTVARLREAETAREEFYRFLVHDLNKPLAAIIGTAERLATHPDLPPPLIPRADRIRSAAQRTQDLVGRLLSHEQIRRGELTLNLRPVDLPALACDVAALFLDRESRIELLVGGRPAPDWINAAPPMQVRADPIHLGRVIQNLLDNALGHATSTVDLRFLRHADVVRIEVWNDGSSLPPDHCERIFEEFVRLPGNPRPGYGLGLSAVRRIVDDHGGRVWAEPGPGNNGMCFVVELPAAPADRA